MSERVQAGGGGEESSIAVLPYTAAELTALAAALEAPLPSAWWDDYPRTYCAGVVEVEVAGPDELTCRLEASGPIWTEEVAAVQSALSRPQIIDIEPDWLAPGADDERRALSKMLMVRVLVLLVVAADLATLAAGSWWWWLLCACSAVQLVSVGRAACRLVVDRQVATPAGPVLVETRWVKRHGEHQLGWRVASVRRSESRLRVDVQDDGEE